MKISGIVIYGDHPTSAKMIGNCLATLRWCDEIVVVDFSRAGLNTALVKKYRVKLVKANSTFSFAVLRNLGAREAKGEWLLYIDPDERVTPALKTPIHYRLSLDDSGIKHVAYQIPRRNYFFGQQFTRAGAWPDYVVRLIKKDALVKWEGTIHEQPVITGRIGQLQEPLIHLTHQNIEEMVLKTVNWSKFEADLRYQQGHPLMTGWRFWRIILTGFWENFMKKQAWRDGTAGTIEGIFQIFSLFFTYVRLWEKQQQSSLADKYRNIDRRITSEWKKK